MLNRLPRSAYFCPHPSASVCPPLQRTTSDFQPSSVSAAAATGQRHLPRSSNRCWPQWKNARILLAISTSQKRLSTNHWVLWWSTNCSGVMVPPLRYVQERTTRPLTVNISKKRTTEKTALLLLVYLPLQMSSGIPPPWPKTTINQCVLCLHSFCTVVGLINPWKTDENRWFNDDNQTLESMWSEDVWRHSIEIHQTFHSAPGHIELAQLG